jgi:hypothetical protein
MELRCGDELKRLPGVGGPDDDDIAVLQLRLAAISAFSNSDSLHQRSADAAAIYKIERAVAPFDLEVLARDIYEVSCVAEEEVVIGTGVRAAAGIREQRCVSGAAFAPDAERVAGDFNLNSGEAGFRFRCQCLQEGGGFCHGNLL